MLTAEVNHLRHAVGMLRTRLVYGLEKVPDERLDWSPGAAAHTPLQIAARTAAAAGFLAHILRGGDISVRPEPPPPPQTRDEALQAVEGACRRLGDVLAGLTEADLERRITPPWGTEITVRQMLWWAPAALGYVQGQLNYLQLAYGDTDPNIPPGWGSTEA
jgi:hypothetical protein